MSFLLSLLLLLLFSYSHSLFIRNRRLLDQVTLKEQDFLQVQNKKFTYMGYPISTPYVCGARFPNFTTLRKILEKWRWGRVNTLEIHFLITRMLWSNGSIGQPFYLCSDTKFGAMNDGGLGTKEREGGGR